MKTDPNIPAFPVIGSHFTEYGLTKREYIATKIMQSLITKNVLLNKDVAEVCVALTDHLIDELNKEK
jgi:hypothetical protein